jgi:hypothetical protein
MKWLSGLDTNQQAAAEHTDVITEVMRRSRTVHSYAAGYRPFLNGGRTSQMPFIHGVGFTPSHIVSPGHLHGDQAHPTTRSRK